MKKIISIALVLILSLSVLSACSKDSIYSVCYYGAESIEVISHDDAINSVNVDGDTISFKVSKNGTYTIMLLVDGQEVPLQIVKEKGKFSADGNADYDMIVSAT